MPQCLLRVARFRGIDMHGVSRQSPIQQQRLHASGVNAERFLRDTLPIAGRFEQDRFERIDEPLYPPLATREALANALCHRDYSIGGGSVGIAVYDDRLEVSVLRLPALRPDAGEAVRALTSRVRGTR